MFADNKGGRPLARAIESIANIITNGYIYNEKDMDIHKRYSSSI